jgi:predicted AlkP superfamily pyrophosphatase or phosphodiesterase
MVRGRASEHRVFLAITCLALSILVAAAARPLPHSAAPDNGPIQHVIIISVDGLKPESYTEADTHGLKIPTLREMVRTGAWSDGVVPVMPSVTYPSHTTMVTGVVPGVHGIFTNLQFDPMGQNLAGWRWYAEDIRVPTLWQVARDRGLRTTIIHWPASVGAAADINVPEYWRANTAEDLKILRALSTPGIFTDTAAAFPDFTSFFGSLDTLDNAWTEMACYAVEKIQPNLLLLHLAQVDRWQHEKGPFSPEANAAIEAADGQIARVMASAKKAGIWQTTAVVVVSDHGFAPISQNLRPGILLRDHGLITLDAQNHITAWKAAALTADGSAYIYLHDADDDATRRALLDIFTPLTGAPGSGIRRVANQADIVKMGGDPGAFLALEAADGFELVPGVTGNYLEPSKHKGTHGYFPDRPEMRASFLAVGPPIGPAKVSDARLIDVAPTAAHWLGLDLSKAEGKPLEIPLRAENR